MKWINPYSVLKVIILLALSVLGCATNQVDQIVDHSYKYETLEITNSSIKEAIDPGAAIYIETKDIIGRFIVLGYEGDEIMICKDEYDIDKKEVKIPIKDIKSIRLKNAGTRTETVGNFGQNQALTFGQQALSAATAIIVFILVLGALTLI